MIPLMKNAFLNEKETKIALSEFILKTEKLSMDSKCREFELEFSKFQSRQYSTLFNSGGSANLALLQALKNLGKLKEGDQVGFSALTWSTNTMPIIQMGLIPVPIDCDLFTLNVNSNSLNERISETNLKALFITNVLGFTADIQQIQKICLERGIILIEDNCESLGTELPSGKTGNFGIASTFSFFVAHHMSTIEGGMVCTDDSDLDEMLKIVRANGWDRNLSDVQKEKWRSKFNITTEFQANYTFYDLGFNFRPTEITGFLGLYQLQFLKQNILKRQENYLRIEKVLSKNTDFILLKHDHINTLSTFAFPFLCKTNELRNQYVQKFLNAKIEIRPMIAGNMQSQPFYNKYVHKTYNLIHTDIVHNCGFYCGNYPELSNDDIETIEKCLR